MFKKHRILVVDDEESVRAVVKEVLVDNGFIPVIAESGEDALILLEEEKDISLVLLDLMMPGLSGFEVLHMLKQDDRRKDIPVIMVSAISQSENKLKAFSEGAADYIVKPFEKSELIARIQMQIRLIKAEEILTDQRDALEKMVEERSAELLDAYEKLKEELEQKHAAEVAMRESEERYRELFECSPESITILDAEGTIIACNLATGQIASQEVEDIVGRSFFELGVLPEEELDNYVDLFEKFVRGEPVEPMEVQVSALGEMKYLEIYPGVLRSEGEITGIQVISRDITQRKLAEAKLRKLVTDLERSNKELEQFAYVASHDLQEPLRMIASYLEIIDSRYSERLDEDGHQFIGYAVDGARRLKTLIQDLLSYSRVHTRGHPVSDVDLNEVVEKVRLNLSKIVGETGTTIRSHDLPVIKADDSQMLQLFQNLAENAIKFKGDVPLKIDIKAEANEDEWVLSVSDNGAGIDPQFHDRIFVIFQRLNGPAESSGTGIGLAICKRIMDRHGGRIWVESEEGKGSTFYMVLPKEPIIT